MPEPTATHFRVTTSLEGAAVGAAVEVLLPSVPVEAEEELPPQAAMLRAMEPAMPSASTLLNFFICFSPLLV